MRCQARRCTAQALDGYDLCDPHQEMQDDGLTISRVQHPKFKEINRGAGRPTSSAPARVSEQKALARKAVAAMFEDREARRRHGMKH